LHNSVDQKEKYMKHLKMLSDYCFEYFFGRLLGEGLFLHIKQARRQKG